MRSSFAVVVGLVVAASTFAAAVPPNIVIPLVDDMGVIDTAVLFLTDETGTPGRYPLDEFYRSSDMRRRTRAISRASQATSRSLVLRMLARGLKFGEAADRFPRYLLELNR